jgi:uncharacterized C2H2 Zn-finger protein
MPELNCPACGALFPNEAELRQHGGQAHANPPTTVAPAEHRDFNCAACGAHFHSEIELKEHGAKAHKM